MRNLKFDDIDLLDSARAPSDARAIWCTISRESPREFRSNFYGSRNRGHAQSCRPADRPDRTTHVRKKEIEKKTKKKRRPKDRDRPSTSSRDVWKPNRLSKRFKSRALVRVPWKMHTNRHILYSKRQNRRFFPSFARVCCIFFQREISMESSERRCTDTIRTESWNWIRPFAFLIFFSFFFYLCSSLVFAPLFF